MGSHLFWVYLREGNSVSFESVGEYQEWEYLTIKGKRKASELIGYDLLEYPSTNGLYSLYAIVNGNKTRIHICTQEFMDKYYNDQPINTMTANPNIFYRGKHVNIKTFVKKQLLRALVPSKMNDIVKSVETYEETFKKELSAMSVIELKTIISNKGYPSSNLTKAKLIEKLLNIYKNN